jgi:hypothetical protein
MAAGDVSLTFTLPTGNAATVFVTGSVTGRGADDRDGQMPRSTGTAAQERRGGGVQESNGSPSTGRTGRIS